VRVSVECSCCTRYLLDDHLKVECMLSVAVTRSLLASLCTPFVVLPQHSATQVTRLTVANVITKRLDAPRTVDNTAPSAAATSVPAPIQSQPTHGGSSIASTPSSEGVSKTTPEPPPRRVKKVAPEAVVTMSMDAFFQSGGSTDPTAAAQREDTSTVAETACASASATEAESGSRDTVREKEATTVSTPATEKVQSTPVVPPTPPPPLETPAPGPPLFQPCHLPKPLPALVFGVQFSLLELVEDVDAMASAWEKLSAEKL
jgi:hypothetical protein